MTDVSAAASALAAAFAAAAELVKSGDFLFSMDTTTNINSNNAIVNFGSTAAAVTHSTKLIAEQLYATTETLSPPSTATSSLTLPPSTRTTTMTTTTMNDLKTNEANVNANNNDDDDEDEDDEPDAEQRLARSRERNREHARRTRLRKKAQLEALQRKVKGLEAEGRTLRQSIEECSIASILVGLSSGSGGGAVANSSSSSGEGGDATSSSSSSSSSWSSVTGSACPAEKVALLVAGKRKRFISDDMMMMTTTTLMERPSQTLALSIDGHTTLIGGGKTHINWKTGVYSDENGLQRKLTAEQLENLRRERNRMHAKMTRDRKKCFIRTIEKTIEELETENERLRSLLCTAKSATTPSSPVTPFSSPKLSATATAVPPSRLDELSASSSPSPAPSLIAEPIEANHTPDTSPAPAATTTSRVSHGFSLIG